MSKKPSIRRITVLPGSLISSSPSKKSDFRYTSLHQVNVSMEAHQRTSSSEAARWEGMWSAGLKPGDAFDAARVEPALASAIALDDASKLDPPLGMSRASEMTALVPGCGRGYAVAALAKMDRFKHATGLEISPTAQKAAPSDRPGESVQSVRRPTSLEAGYGLRP